MDKKALIAEVATRYGIKLGEDDPALMLVDLNLLMLEGQTSEAARNLRDTTHQFQDITTRNVDDFVSVANEALSKFVQRTNEIKAILDGLDTSKLKVDPAPVMARRDPPGSMTWWFAPIFFIVGVTVGLTAAFALA